MNDTTTAKKKAIIFDVDGTMANLDHRLHWVRSKPKNWPAFFEGIHLDEPIETVIRMLKNFHADGYTILVCSGRGRDLFDKTAKWFEEKAGVLHLITDVFMRAEKDQRSDDIVKSELLDEILAQGYEIVAVVDDRPKVIRMWKKRGLFVINVGSGVEF